MSKDRYLISVLNIDGLEIDLSIIEKWIKLNGSGEYDITVSKKSIQKDE